MDPHGSTTEKKQMEVVLVIPGEGATVECSQNPTRDPKVDSLENPNNKPRSPEILKSSPRPLLQHEGLLRRRSIPTSAFSKPKSRFEEPPPPPVSNPGELQSQDRASSNGSLNPRKSGTLLTVEEEDDKEEEVFKKQQMPRSRKWCKVRILIEWLILVLAMGCMVSSLAVDILQKFVIWGLEIWRWCLMVIVICCGRLVTQWFITLIVFLIERNFLFKKKVLYFVYGLKNIVRVCIWLGLVLLTWSLLFSSGAERSAKAIKVLNFVSRALASLLLGSIIWVVKTLLVKILASSFHMNRFFDRIQESIFHQYVLQTLSGLPKMELDEKAGRSKCIGHLSFRSTGKDKGKGGEEQGVIDVAKLHRMRQEKVSAWTMKGLINVIRSSGFMMISNTIDESFGEERDREITSEWEAKAMAYQVFKNVAKPGCKYIDEEDLLRFLSREEVDNVLPSFEGAAETGKIKKSAL